MNVWFYICDNELYDIQGIVGALTEFSVPHARDYFDKEDIVYLYAPEPVGRVVACCEVVEDEFPMMHQGVFPYVKDSEAMSKKKSFLYLKLIKNLDAYQIDPEYLSDYGMSNFSETRKIDAFKTTAIAEKGEMTEKHRIFITVNEASEGCTKAILTKSGQNMIITIKEGLLDGYVYKAMKKGILYLVTINVSNDGIQTEHVSTVTKPAPKSRFAVQGNGNFILGIVGALIGGVISMALWILLYRIGIIASIAGYATAFLVIEGYCRLGKGIDKKGAIACVVIMIVAIYAAFIGGMTLDVMIDEQVNIKYLPDVIRFVQNLVVSDDGARAYAARELIFAYGFSILGSFRFLGNVFNSFRR